MTLFKLGKFKAHSDEELTWKIDCDALTEEDWDTIVHIISQIYKFHDVIGVPNGGLKLAKKLGKYINEEAPQVLVVDDVYTTGKSMNDLMADITNETGYETFGVVVFARRDTKPNERIWPLFTLDSIWRD